MGRSWVARIRGAGLFGRAATRRMIDLQAGQPLILHREPTNPVDRNAVFLTDLYSGHVGYVEKRIAAQIAPLLDSRYILMAVVHSRWSSVRNAHTLIWLQEPPAREHEVARLVKGMRSKMRKLQRSGV